MSALSRNIVMAIASLSVPYGAIEPALGASFSTPFATQSATWSQPVVAVREPSFDFGVRLPEFGFRDEVLHSLDLEQAVYAQFGADATLVSTGSHRDDWRALVGERLVEIDFERAVRDQNGRGFALVSIGVGKNDWRAVHPLDLDGLVVPVLLVAADVYPDVTEVAQAVDRFRGVLLSSQRWIYDQAGATYPQLVPILLDTSSRSALWHFESVRTGLGDASRFVLLDHAIEEFGARLAPPTAYQRTVLAPLTRFGSGYTLGAAQRREYALVPPSVASSVCPAPRDWDTACGEAMYAVLHELGHTFGLQHTCDGSSRYPQCLDSIMETGRPPNAVLFEWEVDTLLESPLFSVK